MEKFDLIVVGSGPGGYVASIRASQLGLKTAIIEKEHLGGICLNWGCIPAKALLKSAELIEKIKHAKEFGILCQESSFDITKIVDRSRSISKKLVEGVKWLLKKNQVTIFEGTARITSPKLIAIESKQGNISLEAENIIIATGARAKTIDGFETDGKKIWTYKDALVPNRVPESMIIIGSGAIGTEFASFYNFLGVKVTILEAANQILPIEDEEIAAIAKKSFESRGIKIFTAIKLEKKEINYDKVKVTFLHNGIKNALEAEVVLMAVGVAANINDLGLENTKVKVDSHIITNNMYQTAESNIYAIGDVAGTPCLAHKASHEGIIAVEHIAKKNTHPINKLNIPGCTYTTPQIASVGMTEKSALSAGYELRVGRFPFYANGKALILGNTDGGLIKTIFDAKTGELLGAHLIGSDVTELIHSYVLAKSIEATESDFMKVVFPHPTLSEMLQESVLQAYDIPIHI